MRTRRRRTATVAVLLGVALAAPSAATATTAPPSGDPTDGPAEDADPEVAAGDERTLAEQTLEEWWAEASYFLEVIFEGDEPSSGGLGGGAAGGDENIPDGGEEIPEIDVPEAPTPIDLGCVLMQTEHDRLSSRFDALNEANDLEGDWIATFEGGDRLQFWHADNDDAERHTIEMLDQLTSLWHRRDALEDALDEEGCEEE